MPHVNIKYFAEPLSDERKSTVVTAVTRALIEAGWDDGVISVAFEPIEKEEWTARVYEPEIINKKELLAKVPNY